MEDPELREALRVYSQWKTYPQLFVDGKLVGGCDIVREMHNDGSFEKLLLSHELITPPKEE